MKNLILFLLISVPSFAQEEMCVIKTATSPAAIGACDSGEIIKYLYKKKTPEELERDAKVESSLREIIKSSVGGDRLTDAEITEYIKNLTGE